MKVVVSILLVALFYSCGVQQKLSASYKLNPGMTKAEVEAIMGHPVKSDFKQNVEEWHYCNTGSSADEFLALFFYEGKLIEKLNYTVTLADTRGATGSCSKFIKMGNYREPDKVIEIRMR
ncbi:MAG: outer membrane protein assembly factor BamE [Nitrososphaerales archaeon]